MECILSEKLYIVKPKATCHITRQASINTLGSVPNLLNRGSCIDACLSDDVTRSFRLYNISSYFVKVLRPSEYSEVTFPVIEFICHLSNYL